MNSIEKHYEEGMKKVQEALKTNGKEWIKGNMHRIYVQNGEEFIKTLCHENTYSSNDLRQAKKQKMYFDVKDNSFHVEIGMTRVVFANNGITARK